MRILQIGKYYPPHKGGMETALRHLTEGLLARGDEVRVLVASSDRRTCREDLPGAPGALIRAGSLGNWNSQPLTVTLLRLLDAELAAFKPHLVHLHLPNPLACLAWRLAPRRSRPPRPAFAVWHHADIVRKRIGGRLVAPLARWCLSTADGVCASSESWRRSSAELSDIRSRVKVMPFGIDLDPFLAAEPCGGGPFLFVGRLVSYKGLCILLEALAGLPEASLDIVGTGPLHKELARRSFAPDLRGRVRLLGEVRDADLPALMAASRALVLPSIDSRETFGLVLVEAMAAGLPLVTSRLPTGVCELNRSGETGWVVEPGDHFSLRQAMRAVLGDPVRARKLGMNGRRLARKRHARTRLAEDMTAWYHELIRPATGGTISRQPCSLHGETEHGHDHGL